MTVGTIVKLQRNRIKLKSLDFRDLDSALMLGGMSLNIKGIFFYTYYPAPPKKGGLKLSSGGSAETKLDSKKSSNNHEKFKVHKTKAAKKE